MSIVVVFPRYEYRAGCYYNAMNNVSVLHVFHVGQSVLNWCLYSILVVGRRTAVVGTTDFEFSASLWAVRDIPRGYRSPMLTQSFGRDIVPCNASVGRHGRVFLVSMVLPWQRAVVKSYHATVNFICCCIVAACSCRCSSSRL